MSTAICQLSKGEDVVPQFEKNETHVACMVGDGHSGTGCKEILDANSGTILHCMLHTGLKDAMQMCLQLCEDETSGAMVVLTLYTIAERKLSIASGLASTAMGYSTTAEGSHATAMGYSTIASDYASVSIGQYNLAGKTATSTTVFSLDNTAFVIGNGVDSNTLSDAFKVMFNGDATVSNDLTVSGQLTIGNQVLTGAHVAQLRNLLTQLAGTDDDQKACLKTKWNTLSTC